MRWWRMFCLLILIASPLALNANAQSPSPRPSVQREAQLADSRQQQSNPAQAQAVKRSAPAVAKPAKPAIQATVRNESSGIVEKQGDDKKSNPSQSVLVWSWSMIQTALQILFTFVTTVATVYVAKFTYRLVQVTKDLHIATEAATNASIKSATAAEKSVEVAERALAAQRPFLNIEKTKLFNLDKPEVNLGGTIWRVFAEFEIQNRGSGIGMIKSLHADFRIWDRNEAARLSNLENILYGPPIVGPGSSTENLFAPKGSANLVLTDADRQDFFAERTRLNLLGTLVYTDMAESVEYTLKFFRGVTILRVKRFPTGFGFSIQTN